MYKTLTGTIIAIKMNKTVVVSVERKFRHPLYRKVITRHKKYKAHSEVDHHVGEGVEIIETRPLSKEKHFRIVEKKK